MPNNLNMLNLNLRRKKKDKEKRGGAEEMLWVLQAKNFTKSNDQPQDRIQEVLQITSSTNVKKVILRHIIVKLL